MKEMIIPVGANPVLFLLAPIVALAPALAAWAVMPFGVEQVLADINAGLLYILALTSLGVYGIIIAGWASTRNTPFSAPCVQPRKSSAMKSRWDLRWLGYW